MMSQEQVKKVRDEFRSLVAKYFKPEYHGYVTDFFSYMANHYGETYWDHLIDGYDMVDDFTSYLKKIG